MKVINHNELNNIIKSGYRNKVQLDVKGHPGIGKSQVIYQTAVKIAKSMNLQFFDWNKDNHDDINIKEIKKYFFFADIRLHQMDPTGLLGIPDISGDYVEWKPIKLFKLLSNKGVNGIIFFDEANLAQDSVLASAYSIIQDSQIGDVHISDLIMKISAGNLPDDGCNVTEEPSALHNRRMNYILGNPNINIWNDWANKNNIDQRVIAFVNWNSQMLFSFDEKKSDNAFPTPRTWEYVSNMISDIKENDMIELFSSGLVGEDAARQFVSFLRLKVTIPISDLLDDPKLLKKYKEEKDFLGIKYIIISNMIDGYENKKSYLDNCMNLALEFEDELLVYFVRALKFRHGKDIVSYLAKCSNKKLIQRIGKNIL